MKKITFALSILCMALSAGYAQNTDNMVAQPTHVVGRSFGSNGEVTKELVSDFMYSENGKLSTYEFPDYVITANFQYSDDYLTEETVYHDGGSHIQFERNLFEYENGQIKSKSHITDNMGANQFWLYSYQDDGRLERIDYSEDNADSHMHWLYEYENDGHTVIESCHTLGLSPGWFLIEKTTSNYTDDYKLSSVIVEKYDLSGAMTSTQKTNYVYTENNLLSECTSQTLENGSWLNSSITRYNRNDMGTVVEQLEGSWNAETEQWQFTKKTTFETTEDGKTYTVSFYKKEGDSWVWDTFLGQPVFFNDYLKPQQRMLTYMAYETAFGYGNVNQIEFTLEWTEKPVYLDVNNNDEIQTRVYPNPGEGQLQIETSVESAVLHVYDAQGRLVVTLPFSLKAVVPTNDWAQGLYVWEVWDGTSKVATGKWVKK